MVVPAGTVCPDSWYSGRSAHFKPYGVKPTRDEVSVHPGPRLVVPVTGGTEVALPPASAIAMTAPRIASDRTHPFVLDFRTANFIFPRFLGSTGAPHDRRHDTLAVHSSTDLRSADGLRHPECAAS